MAKQNILLRSKVKKAQELVRSNQFEQAKELLGKVGALGRNNPELCFLLGVISARSGLPTEAAGHFRKALALRSDDAQLLYRLGVALRESGDLSGSIEALKKALKQQPDHRDATNGLARALIMEGHLDEAEVILRNAALRHPQDAEIRSNLGSVLQNKGLVEQAADCFRAALAINPDLPAYDSYAAALAGQGNFREAVAAYKEGMRRHPRNTRACSNMLLTLNYVTDIEEDQIFREHLGWKETLGSSISRLVKHDNRRDPEKPLRIGYVSPDFRSHSVASYIEPLLAAHDRKVVESFCYSTVPKADETSRRLESIADHWRDSHALSATQLADQIVSDSIDILVDLAGHTARNSLPTFALKPAPVQVTYLGYPNTTGLDTIDYRLTDTIADPQGAEAFYSETLVRLPGCFLCYQPPAEAPDVAPLPAGATGMITFGSFNNLSKINPDVVALWSEVLRSVPHSSIVVKNPALTEPGRRQHYQKLFADWGVAKERVDLIGHTPTREAHLGMYAGIDIALDTFPYNGTTTTCEALYMGVPVITLSGETHRNRVGKSLLGTLGRAAWIADSREQYIAAAVSLARDIGELARIRSQLRVQFAASPLCDSETFAHSVENAYRSMWRHWCAAPTPPS